MSLLISAILLIIFWFILSGRFDFFSISMCFISTVIVIHYHHLDFFKDINTLHIRAYRFFKYIPWLINQIIFANIDIIKRVFGLLPIDPVVVEFEYEYKRPTSSVILANSITLTPGTVTIEAGKKFLIHCISKDVAEDLLRGYMQNKVKMLDV
ncbi:MAG: Na+/H+ antiporter subunit E [bacterium]|nr:Na+/H+ antiporter subunit E [bacterium]